MYQSKCNCVYSYANSRACINPYMPLREFVFLCSESVLLKELIFSLKVRCSYRKIFFKVHINSNPFLFERKQCFIKALNRNSDLPFTLEIRGTFFETKSTRILKYLF